MFQRFQIKRVKDESKLRPSCEVAQRLDQIQKIGIDISLLVFFREPPDPYPRN